MIVIVVGMHRSGTSAMAGLLHKNGIVMGEHGDFHPPPMKENPKGFYENRRFRVVNDRLLRINNYSVKSFNPDVPNPIKSDTMVHDEMVGTISYYDKKYPVWGWKDPRTCLTLEHWLEAIKAVHGTLNHTRLVVPLRPCEQVAQSMRNRGNKEKRGEGQFLDLCRVYNERAVEAGTAAGVAAQIINWDRLIYDAKAVGESLSHFLGYPITDFSHIDPAVADRVDPPSKVKPAPPTAPPLSADFLASEGV